MIEVILFDLGGVLVELTGVPTMLKWTRDRYNEDELWEAWIRSPAVRSFETGQSNPKQFAQAIIKEMELPVSSAEFIDAFTYWPKGLFPGVSDLLKDLKEHYTLACFSNSNELHWSRLMTEMGLEKMFDFYFASHLMGKLKPDEEAYETVLAKLQRQASSVLFLDDNELNVLGAKKAGMIAHRTVGINGITQILEINGILKTEDPEKTAHSETR